MRITGGVLSGRTLSVPHHGVRPTQDKVRAAVYNSLAALVPGARVLDLFAGSGALGVEAWSRGAAFVCWVESDSRTHALLKQNVETLCRGEGGGVRCVRGDALRFLASGGVGEPFDLILADPPYDREGHRNWLEKTLQLLAVSPILSPAGRLVFEQSADEPSVQHPDWHLLRDKTYGGTRLLIYARRVDTPPSPDQPPENITLEHE